MIDIHNHILPNVDDGSRDMGMSIDMARLYIENGFKKIIATPHYIEGIDSTCKEENYIRLMDFKDELKKQKLDLEVFLGNEILVSLEMAKKLDDKTISTLNDTRYILLELPIFDIPLYIEDLFYNLQLKGYIPIIAHPERNLKIIEDPNILFKYIKNGALAQLNLPSLDEKYGKNVADTAEILLKHNMIHFVGTDAHTSRRRSPNVGNAIKTLRTMVSDKKFNSLTYDNANLLIEDKLIEIEEAITYKKKKSFLNFFNR